MKIVDGIKSYILEDDLKTTIMNNKINILNYIDIGHFDSNKIVIKTNSKDIIVKGSDLVVSKLMNNEVLITGNFKALEFR